MDKVQVLKDGMQHVGKLICSNLGARMDSEPKLWRILGLHLGLYNLCLSFHADADYSQDLWTEFCSGAVSHFFKVLMD